MDPTQPPSYPPGHSGQIEVMSMPDLAGGPSASRHVVVGVDRSLGARVALEHAARRVGPGGRLIVANVVPSLSDAISRAVSELDGERRAAAREFLDALAADAG